MIDLDDLLKMLDRLEEREASLIGWGDTAGYFTLQELEDVIADVLPGHDPEEVEDELRRRVMIAPVRDSRDIEVGVRTRMAEAVRPSPGIPAQGILRHQPVREARPE